MKNNEVSQRVRGALTRLETERNVRVLYACESGSRAWGFASQDSDYDVRFLYVHRREWYLSIEMGRDVIEEPLTDQLDVSGWELRKALRLLRKSNPPLLEWMKSPMVYHRNPDFTREFEELAGMFYSPCRCFAHYLHMASGNWKSYLEGRDQVILKKYFYVLRPLLACRWIERSLGQVPMLFQELVDAVLDEREVRLALEALLVLKRAGDELSKSAPDAVLSRFSVVELQRLKAQGDPEDVMGDLDELDLFFRRYALGN